VLRVQVVGFVPTGWLYEMKRETFSGGLTAGRPPPQGLHADPLHACPLLRARTPPTHQACMRRLHAKPGLPFSPAPAVRRKGACSVHLVPYSEHSSYAELLDYVRFLRPHQVGGAERRGGQRWQPATAPAARCKASHPSPQPTWVRAAQWPS
jgi:hypothetical protein